MKRLLLATAAALSATFAGFAAAAQGHEPTTQTVIPPSKLTICHKTGSDTWRRITVSSRAMSNPESKSGRTLVQGTLTR